MIPYGKLYIYEINGRLRQNDDEFPLGYLGTWWEGDHSFLFFSQDRGAFVQELLERDSFRRLVDRFTIDYHDWQGGDEIGPVRVGKMVFVPPWQNVEPWADEIRILLDPCVVFGTGLHPTTRGCLEALCKVYERGRPQRVLDLGTGTGILALACARLGTEKILAVDYNPLAAKTARKNVILNGAEGLIEVREGRAEDLIQEQADLVCCNLHFQILDRLLNTDAFFQKRWSILSGFFERDGDDIAERLHRRQVQLEIISQGESWKTFLGLNPRATAVSKPDG